MFFPTWTDVSIYPIIWSHDVYVTVRNAHVLSMIVIIDQLKSFNVGPTKFSCERVEWTVGMVQENPYYMLLKLRLSLD